MAVASCAASSTTAESAADALASGARELILELSRPGPPTIQIASDLHLEFYSKRQPEEQDALFIRIIAPSAPVLALLGDIGIPTHPIYRRFLLQQAERFEAVLVLAGNHEFYDVQPPGPAQKPDSMTWSQFFAAQGSMKQSVEEMKAAMLAICAEHPRLHYVDNTCVRFGKQPEDAALLCSTLWSHIPEHAMNTVGGCLNDYAMIFKALEESDYPGDLVARDRHGSRLCKLTPLHTSKWHEESVQWLRTEISRIQSSGCECIGVLTHHTPSMQGTSDPKHETPDNLVNHAFSTNLEDVYKASAVKFWGYGHTHFNNDQMAQGTRLLSNQRGYEHEKSEGYRPDFTVNMLVSSSAEDSDRIAHTGAANGAVSSSATVGPSRDDGDVPK